MAVPKKRTSSCKKRMRSAHKHVAVDSLIPCEACGDWRRTHHICSHCGSYNGRVVMVPKSVRRQQDAQRKAAAGES